MSGTRVVSVLAVLVMASVASGATVWNPAANEVFPPDVGNWNEADNWTDGVPGVNDNKAVLNVFGAAEAQVTDAQSIPGGQWVLGDGGNGGLLRVVDGGSLSNPGGPWSAVGYDSFAHLIVETGGLVEFADHMWVAHIPGTGFFEEDRPIVDINGGTITVGQMFGIGFGQDEFEDSGIGYVNVNDGGRLELFNIHSQTDPLDPDYLKSISPDSLLNINGTGVVTISGNKLPPLEVYIDEGRIVANSGADELDVSYDIDTDLTTLRVDVEVPLGADFDGNGVVDGDDFLIWQGTFEGPGDQSQGDATGDGWVDGNDFLVWQQEFGTADGSGSDAVPEPAGLMLVILTGLAAMCRLRVRA